MITNKAYEKIKREIKEDLIKEFVFPILREVKDAEGKYKKEFIKEVLKAAQEKPKYIYNSKTFLGQINKK